MDGWMRAGVLRAGVHGGDLDEAVHRAHLVQIQLQQVDLPQLLLRSHRHRFNRAVVSEMWWRLRFLYGGYLSVAALLCLLSCLMSALFPFFSLICYYFVFMLFFFRGCSSLCLCLFSLFSLYVSCSSLCSDIMVLLLVCV